MSNTFAGPVAHLVGLWDFVNGATVKDTGLADGIAQDGTPINGASFPGGLLKLDNAAHENERFEVRINDAGQTDAPFDADTGTVEVQFRQDVHLGGSPDVVVQRGLYSDRHADGFFELRVTKDQQVQVVHHTGSDGSDVSHTLSTGEDFYVYGDTLHVVYTWDAAAGGTFKVQNLTSNTQYQTDFATAGFTMDIGDLDEDTGRSFVFGARETRNDHFSQEFDGKIDYVAIYDADITRPMGDGVVDGENTGEIMVLGYDDANAPTDNGGDTITVNADVIEGNGGDDFIDGDGGDDTIRGGDGNDTLVGGSGRNVLLGGAQDDTFVGGVGRDLFNGGAGQDNLDYSASTGAVRIDLSANTLAGGFADSDTIQGGIDGVIGSEFNDSLVGFDAESTNPADRFTNEFFGLGGNDTIRGLGGSDRISGGDDEDQLFGGSGNDTIDGGDGSDLISGGAGADVLSGNDGADRFVDLGVGDSVDGGAGLFLNAGNPANTDHDVLDLRGSAPLGGSLKVIKTGPDSNGNGFNGRVEYYDSANALVGQLDFVEIEEVTPCFTAGTMIATPTGERRVESLEVGDKVITRDNGIQEIRWVGGKHLDPQALQKARHLRPVMIRKGALGKGLPERDMMVSPNHRVLISNEKTAYYFEESEVLVAAKHLVQKEGIDIVDVADVTYLHIMFDQHEVILSDGAWTESFQPGDHSLAGVGAEQRQEILELFPELETSDGIAAYAAARRSLKRHEAQLL